MWPDPHRFIHAVGAAMLVVWALRFVALQFPTSRARLRALVQGRSVS